jgi:CMP-N,N'-diacetyllegionaminic acid synthase
MFKGKTILAFTGARKGSKGLANKNILNFAGKPLIGWAIKAARDCRYIDRVIVSTDGKDIVAAARRCGADAPFLRPAQLAKDNSPIEGAIRHALKWLKTHEHKTYDYIVLVQPTSPLRTGAHLAKAVEYYFRHKRSDSDTLISVTKAPQKVGWLLERKTGGYIDFCFDAVKNSTIMRQKNPEFYLPNGLIYIASCATINRARFYNGRSIPFVMSEDVSADIDTREDFDRALKLFKARAKKPVRGK